MTTELIDIQRSAITFSQWKAMQIYLNGARCGLDFIQSI